MASAAERGKVWILEDSPLEAEMARRTLGTGYDVETFADGSVLLERLSNSRALPDALVVDWQLPGISGLEVCRIVRATHDAMRLPILVLTAQAEKTNLVEGFTAGANDYVMKPYDVAELVARVGTLVRTSRLQAAQLRRQRQLALSADVGAALTKGGNLTEVAGRCTRALTHHLDAAHAQIWARRGSELKLLAATDLTQPPSVIPTEIIERVAREQKIIVIDDPNELLSLGWSSEILAFAALPLVLRDETFGVLAFTSKPPISDAVPALTTIADLLALGVARARVEEERSQLLERERASRADAEAANRSKDDFLAMVSHELRTPLNAITGWTTMLMTGDLDEARSKRALETIDRNARSQTQLIEDLLDISRIVSGKLRVEVSTVDVPTVAELALEAVRLQADSKGIALDAHIERSGTITGDADRIQQIIWNLLNNAIKFTPRGGRVTLGVHCRPMNIEISVADDGQGIGADFLPYVFERFRQADGTITRAKGGLGLGLSIVKHLVELHGGTIEAKSAGQGKGSSFVVCLPIRKTDQPEDRPSATFSIPPAAFDKPSELVGLEVLVVDDEQDARDLVKTILESCGAIVTCTASAQAAFELLKAHPPHVLISDIAMPGEDGLSFVRRVRSLPREDGGRTPAVALTAYARLEDRTRALRAGFNSHVAKPVNPAELLAVLVSLTDF